MSEVKKLLVTGGCGFIGSALIRLLLTEHADRYQVVNLDALTYAGSEDNVAQVSGHPHYRFVHGDIADAPLVTDLFQREQFDAVLHLAAESHVDRSILGPEPAVRTNVVGTFTLLEAARSAGTRRFVHISTDEVYGSLEPPHEADEDYPLRPSSPYSATKAGSDLLALSYHTTYHMDVLVTRASNNYGPYQFPEKLIPLMISKALANEPLPIYGDGQQVRDWLYVDDHARGLVAVLERGRPGQVYHIGGDYARTNLEVVHEILKATGRSEDLMRSVKDRPGHDRRYALTSEKAHAELDWHPLVDFPSGLQKTVEWYQANPEWVARRTGKEYQSFYQKNYSGR